MKENIQSVIIDNRLYSLQQAINYILLHGYKYKKVDKTTNFYRFRQFKPKPGDNYYTKDLHNGVKLIIRY